MTDDTALAAVARGSLERLTPTGATGWAWVADAPEVRVPIEVALRGEVVARCIADRQRADLIENRIGDGRHAFVVAFPQPLAMADLALLEFRLVGYEGALGRLPEAASGGSIDELQPLRVRGWLYDTHATGAVRLAVTADDVEVAAGWAQTPRPDVPNPGATTVALGFDLRLHAGVALALPVTLRLWFARGGERDMACLRTFASFNAVLRGELAKSAEPFCVDAELVRLASDGAAARFGVFSGGVLLMDCSHAQPTSVGLEGGLAVHRYRNTVRCLDDTTVPRLVELGLGDRLLDAAPFIETMPVRGAIEAAGDGMLRGWAVDVRAPRAALAVAICIDGVPYGTTRTTLARPDIALLYPGCATAGFALALEPGLLGSAAMQVTAATAAAPAPFATRRLQTPPQLRALPPLPAAAPTATVIVPAYNAVDAVRACLGALLQHTPAGVTVLVSDDASPDPDMGKLLAALADVANVRVHREPVSVGRAAAINSAIMLAGRDDVVLVDPSIRVAGPWFAALRAAAYGGPRIGTASALSLDLPAGHDAAGFARLAAQTSVQAAPVVPAGGDCLYIRREALDAVGLLDDVRFRRADGEAIDFCLRAGYAGWHSAVCDGVQVVPHAGGGDARPGLRLRALQVIPKRYPEFRDAARLAFGDGGPWATARFRVLHAALRRPDRPRPRILLAFGADARRAGALDLAAGLQVDYEPFLLTCDTRVLRLFQVRGRTLTVIAAHSLAEPVRLPAHDSRSYAEAIGGMLRGLAIELLHVAQPAQHGLSLVHVAKSLGIGVVVATEDFYTVSPDGKLLDADEIRPDGSASPLRDRRVRGWRRQMAQLLAAADACVAPAASVRALVVEHFPAAGVRPFAVVPPGRDFARFEALAQWPAPGEPVRILVPGVPSVADGLALIEAVTALDRRKRFEFHFAAPGERTPLPPALARYGTLHADVEERDLPAVVERIRPSLAALLALWPQSDSRTLTGLWACGVPVLVTPEGVPSQLVARHGGGWVLDAPEPAAILAQLAVIVGDRLRFLARLDEVRRWQATEGAAYGSAMMAGHLCGVYAAVLAPQRRLGGLAPAHKAVWVMASDARRTAATQIGTEHLSAPAAALLDSTDLGLRACPAAALDSLGIAAPALIVVQFNGAWDLTADQAARLTDPQRGFRLAFEICPGSPPPADWDAAAAAVAAGADLVLLPAPGGAAHATEPVAGNAVFVGWTALGALAAARPELVSIVIAAGRMAEPVQRCVAAILRHTEGVAYEIVVVDNGSPAEVSRALRALTALGPQVRVIENPGRDMAALGCNIGVAHARGATLALLSRAVEVLDSQWLARLRRTLDEDATIGVVAPKLVGADQRVRHAGVVFGRASRMPYALYRGLPADHGAVNRDRRLQAVSGGCLVLRAADFIKLRGFDPTFADGAEDVDLCLRLRRTLRREATYQHDVTLLDHAGPGQAGLDHAGAPPHHGPRIAAERRAFADRWAAATPADDEAIYVADGWRLRGYDSEETDLPPELRAVTARLAR